MNGLFRAFFACCPGNFCASEAATSDQHSSTGQELKLGSTMEVNESKKKEQDSYLKERRPRRSASDTTRHVPAITLNGPDSQSAVVLYKPPTARKDKQKARKEGRTNFSVA